MDISHGARIMKIGFVLGRYKRQDIAGWVNAHIMRMDSVEGALLELAGLDTLTDADIVSNLASFYSTTSVQEKRLDTRMTIGYLGRFVESREVKLETAIQATYSLLEALSEEEQIRVYQLDDAYDLLRSGNGGDVEEVRSQFLEFASHYYVLIDEHSAGDLL